MYCRSLPKISLRASSGALPADGLRNLPGRRVAPRPSPGEEHHTDAEHEERDEEQPLLRLRAARIRRRERLLQLRFEDGARIGVAAVHDMGGIIGPVGVVAEGVETEVQILAQQNRQVVLCQADQPLLALRTAHHLADAAIDASGPGRQRFRLTGH